MPPFQKDVVSTYFAHYHNNPIPGNDMVRPTYLCTHLPTCLPTYRPLDLSTLSTADPFDSIADQIQSERKLTPFGSATSKKQSDGTCQILVTLAGKPSVDPAILVSIDGVELSCLMAAYSKVADAFVALDAYSALAHTTGKVPATGTNVTIVLKSTSDGTLSTHSVTSTYGYYTSLKVKLDKTNEEASWGMRTYECGGMAMPRWGGKVNPLEPEKKCAIDGVMPTVFTDSRAEALAAMQPDKLGFAVFGESKNIETGRDTDMSIDMLPNFGASATTRVCKFTAYGLYDKAGNDLCRAPIPIAEGVSACSFDALKLATAGTPTYHFF